MKRYNIYNEINEGTYGQNTTNARTTTTTQ